MKTRHTVQKFLTIFLVAKVIFCKPAYAQCPVSATMTVKESRCRENGSITVNVSPAGSYTYEITSGPELAAVSSSNVFSGLEAGNYVVTIHGSNSCKLDVFVTVPGTYKDPGLLNATVTDILCPGNTGCITAVEPVDGRRPYTYSIIAGPVTRPSQSSKSFCGLPAGDYKLQAYDSCGVVRTSDFSIGYDTADFYGYAVYWEIEYANCKDIIIKGYKGYASNTVHSQLKLWYITPDGDTLKVNDYNNSSTEVDTLLGMAGKYGTWQAVVFDECNRSRVSNFDYYERGIWIPTFDANCDGTHAAIDNPWRFGVGVGYRVRKCSDNSIVFDQYQTANNTDWWSNHFFLNYDTCYYFEAYNECGETVNWTNSFSKPALDISACSSPSCSTNGRVDIMLSDNSGNPVKPLTFTIINGPANIGTAVSLTDMYDSWTKMENLLPGTYTIVAADACGRKDTLIVAANNPLVRKIEITQKPNCSGGANVHVKVTSNYLDCLHYYPDNGDTYVTYVDHTAPGYTALNILVQDVTPTTAGVWEADYLNVNSNTLQLSLTNNAGCSFDTTININKYIPPAMANMKGYVCSSTNIATLYFNVNNGVAPYHYRIKPSGETVWGPWQDSSIFSGVRVGTYDVNVQDACPNGSIRSINFTAWERSAVNLNKPCAKMGTSLTLSAEPALEVVTYEWVLNGHVVGTGPTYTIPSYAAANDGQYKLRQNYRGGVCVDSSSQWVLSCSVLPVNLGTFTGKLLNNTSLLEWTTTTEAGLANFTIERSPDAQHFKKIGVVKNKEQANGAEYSFIDKNILEDNFYRISFTNQEGTQQYSSIVRLSRNKLVNEPVQIRPVPFKSWFVMEIKSDKRAQYTILVFDVAGNKVAKKQVNVIPGINSIWFDQEVENLAAGYYFVEVTGPDFSQRNKILKQ